MIFRLGFDDISSLSKKKKKLAHMTSRNNMNKTALEKGINCACSQLRHKAVVVSIGLLKCKYPLNPAAWLVPRWDTALEWTPCMFYERLIPVRLQAKFFLAPCICECVFWVLLLASTNCKCTHSWLSSLRAGTHHSILLFPFCLLLTLPAAGG